LLKFTKLLTAVDSHTAGESTRVITGLPRLKGKTLCAQRDFLRERFDWIRMALTWEPRGIGGVVAALVPPADTRADLGIIFLHSSGYPEMCGHGTMGAVVAAAHVGLLELQEPTAQIVLDTPAGLITTKTAVREGKIDSVTVRNVPSFVWGLDVDLHVPGLGRLAAQIAYGGNYYALVDGEQISGYGCDLDLLSIDELVALGNRIIRAADDRLNLRHPVTGLALRLEGALITRVPTRRHADVRSIAISRTSVDRSPCGTGLSARMAVLHAKGQLDLGQTYVQEGLVRTCFSGVLVEEVLLGEVRAVVPEITGQAFITGFYQAVLDGDDPLAGGFQVSQSGTVKSEGV
jgi:proline racemase